jgi:hypothetical protein
MHSDPGLHRFVVALSIDATRRRWEESAEPWMACVEFEPAGPERTVVTVRPPAGTAQAYEIAYLTAQRVEQFVRRTRARRAGQRRGDVLPPFGAVAGGVDAPTA